MFYNNFSSGLRQNGASHVEKSSNTLPRNPIYFLRRPFPQFRRRAMSGRFPSTSYRPFIRTPFRPDYPIPRGMHPPTNIEYENLMCINDQKRAERPIFPQQFLHSSVENGNAFPFSPRTALLRNNVDNNTIMSPNLSPSSGLPQNVNIAEDIWIETKAPNGRKYYYSAKTRETKWERPENVRILNLQQIKCSMSAPLEQLQVTPNPTPQAINPRMNPQPCGGPYNAPIIPIPRNMGIIPGMILFPPPTLCTPPPVFTAGPSPICLRIPETMNSNFNSKPIQQPVLLSVKESVSLGPETSIVTHSPSQIPEICVENRSEILDANSSSIEKAWTVHETTDGKSYYYNKVDKTSTWVKPDSISNGSTVNDSQIISISNSDTNEVKQTSVSMDIDNANTDDLDTSSVQETKDCSEPISIHHNSPDSSKDSEQHISDKNKSIETKTPKQQTDKSRPVSSTPVPGSSWCVVWTGDNKVFFYDASRKQSVWEQPDELKNRADVRKLIESPPVPPDTKQINADSGPDVKKIKMEDSKEQTDVQEETNNDSNFTVKEDAVVLEARAAKEREAIPYEKRVEVFCKMLAEKKISAFSTWEKELHKIVFDARYLLLSSKERKQVFESYVKEIIEEEKNERKKLMRDLREKYKKLLREAGVTSKTRFSDFAQRYSKDERFKAIEKIKERENIFNEFINEISHKEREHKLNDERKNKFFELLNEVKVTNDSLWSDIEKNISDDSRYKAVSSNSKEAFFQEYMRNCLGNNSLQEKEKEERVNASIRIREKEVQRDLSVHLKDRDREREWHKHESSVASFKALTTDLVKSPSITWHAAKKLLKEDHRWESVRSLDSSEKERLFNKHINYLNLKKKELFHKLLDEIQEITLTSTWCDIRHIVQKDERCARFSTNEKTCEKEFKEYIRNKLKTAKADYKELLKETKLITYKSKELITDKSYLHSLEKILQNDKRYLVLECLQNERREMLLSYIEKLHSKGPPPPPTATDPSRNRD